MSNFKYLPPQPLLPPSPKGGWGTLTGALIATSFKLPSNADYTNPIAGLFTYSPPAKYRGGGDWEPQADIWRDVYTLQNQTFISLESIFTDDTVGIPITIESDAFLITDTTIYTGLSFVISESIVESDIETLIISCSDTISILDNLLIPTTVMSYVDSVVTSDNDSIVSPSFGDTEIITLSDALQTQILALSYSDSIIDTDVISGETFISNTNDMYNPTDHLQTEITTLSYIDTFADSDNGNLPFVSFGESESIVIWDNLQTQTTIFSTNDSFATNDGVSGETFISNASDMYTPSDIPSYNQTNFSIVENLSESESFQLAYQDYDTLSIDDGQTTYSTTTFVYVESIIETDSAHVGSVTGGSYSIVEKWSITDGATYKPIIFIDTDSIVDGVGLVKFNAQDSPIATDNPVWVKP